MIGVLMRIFSFSLVSWLGPESPFLFVWAFNTADASSSPRPAYSSQSGHSRLSGPLSAVFFAFLASVQEVFLKNRKLVEADLYEPPLTVFGRNAVGRFFMPQEIRELLERAQALAA
jgi:hypothetical protein